MANKPDVKIDKKSLEEGHLVAKHLFFTEEACKKMWKEFKRLKKAVQTKYNHKIVKFENMPFKNIKDKDDIQPKP